MNPAHQVMAGDVVVKQSVLVRMMACAAREEVGSVAGTDFLNQDTNPAVLETTNKKAKSRKGARVSWTRALWPRRRSPQGPTESAHVVQRQPDHCSRAHRPAPIRHPRRLQPIPEQAGLCLLHQEFW